MSISRCCNISVVLGYPLLRELEEALPEAPFWPRGNPGEAVPTVDVADLRAVWNVFEALASRNPGERMGVDVELIKQACSRGADIPAVTYRYMMLQMLEMLGEKQFPAWRQIKRSQDATLSVAAKMPMKWMETGVPQTGLPFDADSFFLEIGKESNE